MAKRKKSKKQPRNEKVAEVQDPTAVENSTPAEAEATSPATKEPTSPVAQEYAAESSENPTEPVMEEPTPEDFFDAWSDQTTPRNSTAPDLESIAEAYASAFSKVDAWPEKADIAAATNADPAPAQADETESIAAPETKATSAPQGDVDQNMAPPEGDTKAVVSDVEDGKGDTDRAADNATTTEADALDAFASTNGESDNTVVTDADAADTVATTDSGNSEAAVSAEADAGNNATAEEAGPDSARLESIIESLLFASNKALGLAELKRLLAERDGKKITAAVQSLAEHRKGTGIEVASHSSGWHLRTNTENAPWVSKLLVGKPVRLSRAMLETLAIVAYRQPVTRPEVDDIRGVDCGPVLKTLLERGLVRIIGKKEEVGRPMLYGTTPEFLRVFNLQDLSELPTLREFYDLSAENQSRVESEHGAVDETLPPSATTAKPDVALTSVSRGALSPEVEDEDPLLDELDEASQIAKKALGDLAPPSEEEPKAEEATPDGESKTEESVPPTE
jgi:segregation and condensation protein B